MNLAQTLKFGAWLLIGLNVLMAMGSIWVFMRMAPAIEVIIDRNERSLQACEGMLGALAQADENSTIGSEVVRVFQEALKAAQNSLTESDEPAALQQITAHYQAAFQGSVPAKKRTIIAITHLGRINRDAMIFADKRAQQLGNAGAWWVVFMAAFVFMAGMVSMRYAIDNVIKPLEEIYAVLAAHREGNTHRRCTGSDFPKEIQKIFVRLNEILDKGITHRPP